MKKIKDFPFYFITKEGKVFSTLSNKFLKPVIRSHTCMYFFVTLIKKRRGRAFSVCIHRLVAEAFIKRIHGKNEVNHKNGFKTDNRLVNLEWVNASENAYHALKIGTRSTTKGENHGSTVLSDKDILEIRKRYAEGDSQTKLGEAFSLHQSSIHSIVKRKTWKHI